MIIGITGRKRSGKDLTALYIQEETGMGIRAFGDAVKEAMIGIPLRGVVVRRDELYIQDGKSDHRDLDLKIDIHSVYKYIQEVMEDIELEFTLDEIYGILEKYDYFSFRRLMQIIATDLAQSKDKLFWVKRTLADCLTIMDGKSIWVKNTKDNFIVSDVRFQHEYDAITRLGGKVIKVDRGIKSTDNHISENADIPFDKMIFNTGSKDELKEKINTYLKEIQ